MSAIKTSRGDSPKRNWFLRSALGTCWKPLPKATPQVLWNASSDPSSDCRGTLASATGCSLRWVGKGMVWLNIRKAIKSLLVYFILRHFVPFIFRFPHFVPHRAFAHPSRSTQVTLAFSLTDFKRESTIIVHTFFIIGFFETW